MASTKTISIFYDAGKPTYIYLKLKPTSPAKTALPKTKARSARTETKRDGRPSNSAHISEGMKR